MDKIVLHMSLVFLGGGLGSVLRFLLGIMCKSLNTVFPVATLLANVMAAFIIGVLFFKGHKLENQNMWSLFAIGLCGGLSTFSAFSLETFELFRNGHTGFAWMNILVSVVMSIAAIFLLSLFLQQKS